MARISQISNRKFIIKNVPKFLLETLVVVSRLAGSCFKEKCQNFTEIAQKYCASNT